MYKSNKIYRRFIVVIILLIVVVGSIPIKAQEVVQAKSKKIAQGVDSNGIKWTYDKGTKTLTFSGKGDMYEFIMDGHGPEPDWFCWDDDTEHIVIKEGITYLTSYSFTSFVHVKTVSLPDTLLSIGEDAFYSCMSLRKITIPKNITRIEDSAFSGCENLKQITLPKKLKYIGDKAFIYCESLTEISIPDSVTFIGNGAFYNCKKLKSITLPNHLKTIHSDLFGECSSLKKVTIPQSVQTICDGAFRNSAIETIVIPQNVTKFKCEGFEYGVFEDYPNLSEIKIKTKKLTKCYKNTFRNFPEDAKIYVPKGTISKYKKLFYASGLEKGIRIKDIVNNG